MQPGRPDRERGLVPQRRHQRRLRPEGVSGGARPGDHAPSRARRRTRERGGRVRPAHSGLNVTDDAFYAESPEWTSQMTGLGLLNVEMESAALFVVAAPARPSRRDGLLGLEQPRRRRERVRHPRPARRRVAPQHRGRPAHGRRPRAVTPAPGAASTSIPTSRARSDPQTAAELAAALGRPGPRRWMGGRARMRDAGHAHRRSSGTWRTPTPCSRTPDAVRRIVREAVEDADARRRSATSSCASARRPTSARRRTLDEVVAAACDGVADATRHAGMRRGARRVRAAAPRSGHERRRGAGGGRFAGRGVVGLRRRRRRARCTPTSTPMRDPFAIAAAAGLGLTAHAAEAGPAPAVREAVRAARRDRASVTARGLPKTPELLAWAAEAGRLLRGVPDLERAHRRSPLVRASTRPCIRRGRVRGRGRRRRPDHDGQPPCERGTAPRRARSASTADDVERMRSVAMERAFCEPSRADPRCVAGG